MLRQALDEREQLPDIVRALAFRSLAQARVGTLLFLGAQALDEQARVGNHPLAGGTRGTQVMLEPGLQLAGAQRGRRQRRE